MAEHVAPDECELCPELRGEANHRFAAIYGASAGRIAVRTPRFAAMPTLGQLFAGSTLVMPFEHVETLAALPMATWGELTVLVERVRASVSRGGQTVVFEHGATRQTAGACGIYHAHLHVVPVPGVLTAKELLVAEARPTADLATTLESLQGSQHYAFAQGTNGDFAARRMDNAADPLPSQHLRRSLTKHFALLQPWDWRAYATPQPEMAETLQLLAR